jgi:hypothetical protein
MVKTATSMVKAATSMVKAATSMVKAATSMVITQQQYGYDSCGRIMTASSRVINDSYLVAS